VKQPRLYILCGLPFAGKSTLAKDLAQALGLVYIELDAINGERGLGLNGASISSLEWEGTYQESYRRLDHFLSEGQSVVYDATNFTREQRDRLRIIAMKHGLPSKVIYLDVPEAVVWECWQQNRETGNRFDVRDEDFAQVVDNFQPPTSEENVVVYNQTLSVSEWIRCNLM